MQVEVGFRGLVGEGKGRGGEGDVGRDVVGGGIGGGGLKRGGAAGGLRMVAAEGEGDGRRRAGSLE